MTETFDEKAAHELMEVLRRHSRPLAPAPTDVGPQLVPLEGIRAVLFDVYGTLFVSGSGDVGTSDVDSQPQAFREAMHSVRLPLTERTEEGVRLLLDTIAAHHARDRQQGVEFPEVDIRDVWTDVLKRFAADRFLGDASSNRSLVTRLALEYEVRVNPVWPMPEALSVLTTLGAARLSLGIISNAQVFTPLLFSSLCGQPLENLGFDPNLCAWSYEHHQAKPGTYLYEHVWRTLKKRGFAAREVLFVGNDRLKDIWPASRIGFRTALFAGDARSYRPRPDDVRLRGVRPDIVLTNLAQLPECVLTR